MSDTVRSPSAAGKFYTADPDHLEREVHGFLDQGQGEALPACKAIIAPHAGYLYSGAIAGSAFRVLEHHRGKISRVVVVGPSHYFGFSGLAGTCADAFETPLGKVPIDKDCMHRLAELPGVTLVDAPHEPEHAIEVELPFLQAVLGDFTLVPLLAGTAETSEAAQVLDAAWGGSETLLVISSDLSHYHPYTTAQRMDRFTSGNIEHGNTRPITSEYACGWLPIQALVECAGSRGLQPRILDVRNSGDTAGPRNQVVGYGAYAFLG